MTELKPWTPDPTPPLRDAKQTFIIKGLPVEGQTPSREFGFPLATLSLVDLLALAKSSRVVLTIRYEEGFRTTLKPIPTLEILNAPPSQIGTPQSEETLPS